MATRSEGIRPRRLFLYATAAALVLGTVATAVVWFSPHTTPDSGPGHPPKSGPGHPPKPQYKPRREADSSGYGTVTANLVPWRPDSSLEQIAASWREAGHRLRQKLDLDFSRYQGSVPPGDQIIVRLLRASCRNYEGEPGKAYESLAEARAVAEADPLVAADWLFTVIAFQGVAALRRGETDNCVLCRGESSCILPLSPAAVHAKPDGSRLAVRHFTEYLAEFPDDPEIRWLLNVAHMTLGEHPGGVDPRFRVSLDRYTSPEHGIGKFRDIGHLAGVNRLNQGGGAILDDFDGDDRLDIVFTSYDPTQPMVFYRNKGDGTFEDRTKEAGLEGQLGGLYCVQADYDNDGRPDIYIPRGAWMKTPMRPSLLRNNGDGTFTDVTAAAGLLDPANSITAQWADYDNDGFLDLFVCNETGPCRLYRNKGDGTFEEVSARAGVRTAGGVWKGVAWVDVDGDRYPDLFLNNLGGTARLYRNNRDGTFTDATAAMNISGPSGGFSCWAFDYDNDGWPDLFATSYLCVTPEVVRGLGGEPPDRPMGKLYRNLGGKGFRDVTAEAGVGGVYAAMGSNFADFDNDGFPDFYLGTGSPDLSMLVPNRMFRNLGGRRFADITGSSGTGHLQKGHGVACGDWSRTGVTDVVIQMGGAVPGDRYHNVLFRNPGNANHWLNVKLVGERTNRSAVGARIKVVTAGDSPQTIYRWVSSGSSFGANPLEQHIGLGKADRVAVLEVYWPTTDTTQVFRDVGADQGIEVTESAPAFRKRAYTPIPVPE